MSANRPSELDVQNELEERLRFERLLADLATGLKDADREWVYDRASSTGRLDKALDETPAKGWTVIDMKCDWKVIFPYEAGNSAENAEHKDVDE